MNPIDLLSMAKGNLSRRKLRTALTVLGIVIGTISIVIMIALGLGIQTSIQSEFSSMGSLNVIEVYKGQSYNQRTRLSEYRDTGKLQEIDIEYMTDLDGVDDLAPVLQSYVKIVANEYEASAQVRGMATEKLVDFGFEVGEGRLPSNEITKGSMDVEGFFGKQVLQSFSSNKGNNNGFESEMYFESGMGGFGGGFNEPFSSGNNKVDIYTDRLRMTMDSNYSLQQGQTLTKAKVYPLKGVGILKDGDYSKDGYLYLPMDFVRQMTKDYNKAMNVKEKEGYDMIYLKVNNTEKIAGIIQKLEAKGYSAYSMSSVLDSVNNSLGVIQIALGAIGAISLLVAAIGITNTMVMAISERKKEIGVLKVIGATIRDIKYMFLLEAGIIGMLGGFIGIIACAGIVSIINSPQFSAIISGGGPSVFQMSLPPWLMISSVFFTGLVGVVSGYLPARKAMSSSALAALRNE